MPGSGSGQSLVSIPLNRPLKNEYKDGRGGLGGLVVGW